MYSLIGLLGALWLLLRFYVGLWRCLLFCFGCVRDVLTATGTGSSPPLGQEATLVLCRWAGAGGGAGGCRRRAHIPVWEALGSAGAAGVSGAGLAWAGCCVYGYWHGSQ